MAGFNDGIPRLVNIFPSICMATNKNVKILLGSEAIIEFDQYCNYEVLNYKYITLPLLIQLVKYLMYQIKNSAVAGSQRVLDLIHLNAVITVCCC